MSITSMSYRRDLLTAGIGDPRLQSSYLACQQMNARYGRTFFLATWLLPPAIRPAVHALYAFARRTDEIVDSLDPALSTSARERRLTQWIDDFVAGRETDPLLPAVHHTVEAYDISPRHFEAFFAAMAMDLTVSEYPSYEDLAGYMAGSAAAIGHMLLPVLGTAPGMAEVAAPYAGDLGVAFQLTNFIRDVGEDLQRNRLYLPKEDLAMFAVSRDDLEQGLVTAGFRRLLAFEIARAREVYRAAEPGIRLLAAESQACVRTAFVLYGEILAAVEAADYRVLDRRVSVSTGRRLSVAGRGWVAARRARSRVTG
ncbi:MAG TPA: phytoene/squalene synthase family protein [Mycobacteriales bacterium]|nr:phytoene/squalene synthase family protein [Mycobacteriales bacterium]